MKPILLALLTTMLLAACVSQKKSQSSSQVRLSKQDRMDLAMQQEWEMTKDPALGFAPRQRLWEAQRYAQNLLEQGFRNAPGLTWQERGPNNVGGRTRSILVDLNDTTFNTVWAGSVGGGLWKSTNFTASNSSWTRVNDLFDNIAVSCIAQDPARPDTILFGTGEGWYNSDAARGDGIWRTTDGGKTWAQLPATNDNADFQWIQKIAFRGKNQVYACTRTGLWRSENAGETWQRVLSPAAPASNRCADVEIGANGHLYVSFGILNAGKIYKSTTGDPNSWTDITPAGNFRRIELATTPADSNRLYALCERLDTPAGIAGFYRCIDAASLTPTWTKGATPLMCDQGTTTHITRERGSSQAWYDLILAVDPNNPDVVCAGGVDAAKTTDGGNTWSFLTSWVGSWTACGVSGAPYVHADQHAIVFFPGSSAKAIWGTDGGVFYTANLNASPAAFTAKNNGYNVTQYYATAIHPQSGTFTAIAGAQDNGTHRVTGEGLQPGTSVTGGDGAFCHIDRNQSNIQISSYVYSDYWITNNNWQSNTRVRILNGSSSTGRFINPTDYDDVNNVLYCAHQGGKYGLITGVGSTNTTGERSISAFGTGQVSAVTVSPNDTAVVYFGLSNGKVVKVTNPSSLAPMATDISTGLPSAYLSCIAVEKGNENHLLICYSNYGVNSLWESTNGGTSWTSVEGNMPDIPVRWCLFDPNKASQALAATELGVWTTDLLQGAATVWTPANNGLANVKTNMLQLRDEDQLIIAATHGRGLFTTNTLSIPVVSFGSPRSEFAEASTSGTLSCGRGYLDVPVPLSVTRSPDVNTDVLLSIVGSSATHGLDYQLLIDSLTFTPGGPTTLQAIVRIVDDHAYLEPKDSIILQMTVKPNGGNAKPGSQIRHTLVIRDNDEIPVTSQRQVVIGTGSAACTVTLPFKGSRSDARCQLIYRAADLTAGGMTATEPLVNLAFFVCQKNSTDAYRNFTVKLLNTTAILGNFVNTANATTVFSGDYTTRTGLNILPFSVPFSWDGTSNLIIEICYDNATPAGGDDAVQSTNDGTSNRRIGYRLADTGSGCSLTSGSTYITGDFPNIRFNVPPAVQPVLSAPVPRYVGPREQVAFSAALGMMLVLENNTDQDCGCVTVEVDREGSSALPFWNDNPPNFLASKTFKVQAENNSPDATYTIRLYYRKGEAGGWAATTGNALSDFRVVKVRNHAISEVTPATPYESEVSVDTATVLAALDTVMVFSGVFSGFSGFGGGLPGNPAPLPVTWSGFEARFAGDRIDLLWTTAGERDNKGFDPERSVDGLSFSPIGHVPGKGRSSQTNSYYFPDREGAALKVPVLYYRLRQTDANGTRAYSPVVAVPLPGGDGPLRLFPNPTNGRLWLDGTAPLPETCTLSVSDMGGRVLVRAALDRNERTPRSWDLSSLP